MAEYQSTFAMKTKDRVTKTTAAEEMCKMARAAHRADNLRWSAVEAAAREVAC